jgi:hypothetical protein
LAFVIPQLDGPLLDSEIDLSESVISEPDGHTLSVRSRIGRFRIFLALVMGGPLAYFIYVLLHAPSYPLAQVIAAIVFSPFLAFATALFGLSISTKAFDRVGRQARLTLRILAFTREKSILLPGKGVVRVCSEWGTEDTPALWFHVRVGEREELGFCAAWRYRTALHVARRLADFLSYELIDVVSDDHRLKARDAEAVAAPRSIRDRVR